MLFRVSSALEYTARFPTTLILNIQAQRHPSQTVLEEQLTIDPPIKAVAPAALAEMLRLLPHDRASAARLKEGIGIAGYYRGRPAVFGAAPVTRNIQVLLLMIVSSVCVRWLVRYLTRIWPVIA